MKKIIENRKKNKKTVCINIVFQLVLKSSVRIPGKYSTEFYSGRLRTEVQPLTLLYTIFDRKGTPFVQPLLTNGNPEHTSLER